MCRIRLELYAQRNNLGLLVPGLILLIIAIVFHYLLNQKLGCKLRRNFNNANFFFTFFTRKYSFIYKVKTVSLRL